MEWGISFIADISLRGQNSARKAFYAFKNFLNTQKLFEAVPLISK